LEHSSHSYILFLVLIIYFSRLKSSQSIHSRKNVKYLTLYKNFKTSTHAFETISLYTIQPFLKTQIILVNRLYTRKRLSKYHSKFWYSIFNN